MAALLVFTTRWDSVLVVGLLVERAVRDAACVIVSPIHCLARTFGRLFIRRLVGNRLILLIVRPRLFWHRRASGDTVASGMPDPAIAFVGVSFGRGGDRAVLIDFSLEVAPGEVFALVGRSGAGKSTILKLVNRLLVPTAGQVTVDGRPTLEWDPIALRRHIGYVLQDVGLFPHMTIGANVGMPLRLAGWPEERTAVQVARMLELVGLPAQHFEMRWPDQLSGGQRQRAGVARALAVDPPILLMDEPFGALDPMTRAELHREFHRIQARVRKTIVIVTHDMGEAFALADRIGVVDEGRLVACEAPSAIARSRDPQVRQLLDAMPAVDRIARPHPEREASGFATPPADGSGEPPRW
jgi:osmoprotectant transport system ATP-binding protein